MTSQQRRGNTKQAKGRVKEAVGILTHNEELEERGTLERTAGAIDEGIGKARQMVGDLVERAGEAIKK